MIEDVPDAQGGVYTTLRGWLANCTEDTTPDPPHGHTRPHGPARLHTGELRGRAAMTDVDLDYDITTGAATHQGYRSPRPQPHPFRGSGGTLLPIPIDVS